MVVAWGQQSCKPRSRGRHSGIHGLHRAAALDAHRLFEPWHGVLFFESFRCRVAGLRQGGAARAHLELGPLQSRFGPAENGPDR